MIKIGICDDEKYYLNKVRRLAEDNLKALCIQDAEIRCYTSGKEMCLDEQFLEECSILFWILICGTAMVWKLRMKSNRNIRIFFWCLSRHTWIMC